MQERLVRTNMYYGAIAEPRMANADSESDEQHSMLPDTQFSGSFAGDLKDWFEALVRLGRFTDATYVNIGNAG